MPRRKMLKMACALVCSGFLWVAPAMASPTLGQRPWRVDVGSSYNPTQEILGNIDVDWLFDNLFNLRLETALGASEQHFSGHVVLGPLLQFDVWTWVPAWFVGLGWHHGPNRWALVSRVQVRRYITFNTGIELGAGIFWQLPQKHPQPSVFIGYFFDL